MEKSSRTGDWPKMIYLVVILLNKKYQPTIQDIELDQGLEYYLLTKQNWDLECWLGNRQGMTRPICLSTYFVILPW